MTFTGRIGIVQSQPGNIVLGVVDSFGLGTFDFLVHVLGPRRIRVLFDQPVTDLALVLSSYSLSTSAPLTSILPPIIGASFYDETRRSVVLQTSLSLTSGVTYSLQCFGIGSLNGLGVTTFSRSFVANAPDPPRAIGAWQSTRGAIDIRFDREVGQFSVAATASIRSSGALPGSGVAMTQLVWSGQPNIPGDTLRFTYPPGIASSDSYTVDYVGVSDVSLNSGSGPVKLELALRSPLPYDYTKLRQIQLVDAYVSDISADFLQAGMLRVVVNCPPADAENLSNWTITQFGAHPVVATSDIIATPDATDLPSLIVLCNAYKSAFNAHLGRAQVHLRPDVADIIVSATASDLTSSQTMITEIQGKYAAHRMNESFHLYPDSVNYFNFIAMEPGNLALAVSVMNSLKARFNSHLQSEYPVTVINVYQDINSVTSFASPTGGSCVIVSPHSMCVEFTFNLQVSTKVKLSVKATIQSDDLGSVTNPLDYTGSIEARSASSPAALRAPRVTSVGRVVDIESDRELDLSGSPNVVVSGIAGRRTILSLSRTSTLEVLRWAVKQTMMSYVWHISSSGAQHQVQDTVNTIPGVDYPGASLSEAIDAVNFLRSRLISHMADETFHFHKDPAIDAILKSPEATDFDSAVALMAALRDTYAVHSQAVGPHLEAGPRISSAPLLTVLRVGLDDMTDLSEMSVIGSLNSTYRDNLAGESNPYPIGKNGLVPLTMDLRFIGLAVPPSIASAIPRIGLLDMDSGTSFVSDMVQVFFTKPMSESLLGPGDLSLTGPGVLQRSSTWILPDVMGVVVSNMRSASYTVTSSGLADSAGNQVT